MGVPEEYGVTENGEWGGWGQLDSDGGGDWGRLVCQVVCAVRCRLAGEERE